eukprot:gene19886-21827_t
MLSKSLLLGFCLLVLAVVNTNGLLGSNNHWHLKKLNSLKKLKKIMLNVIGKPNSKEIFNSVQTGYMLQKLDHFNPAETRQFYQRYYVSTMYWDQSTGPVFVYVGGEEELFSGYLLGGEIVELAQKYKALLLGLEHRFYGKSVPTNGMKLENLKYLTSHQALEDLKTFHAYASTTYRLTSYNRWILQGGSYPGALSAWGRSKFPNLFFGSIATSAPVVAEVDFPGYMTVVAASLSAPEVGGSTLCSSSVQQAFETIETMITSRQFTKLQQDFSSCGDISSPNDTTQFVENIANIFTNVVQYNDETSWMDVRKVCGYMTNTYKTAYDRLIDVNKAYLAEVQMQCIGNSYKEYIASLKYDVVDPSGYANARQWYYQTCNEFGYYQSCEPGTGCVFSTRITMQSMLNVCEEVYNITNAQVYKNVAKTNAYYGEKHLGVSRIIFPNGSIDPWHVLSILRNQTSQGIVAVYMKGTAHCANMNPTQPTAPQSLKDGKKEVDMLVGQWLQ